MTFRLLRQQFMRSGNGFIDINHWEARSTEAGLISVRLVCGFAGDVRGLCDYKNSTINTSSTYSAPILRERGSIP